MHLIARRILSTFDQLERDSLDLHTLFELMQFSLAEYASQA